MKFRLFYRRMLALRTMIINRVEKMRARRLPLLPFPECQSEERYLPGMRPVELDKVY